MLAMLGNAKVSGYGRDNVMELWIKFITIREGVGWNLKAIEDGGNCLCLKVFKNVLVDIKLSLKVAEVYNGCFNQ